MLFNQKQTVEEFKNLECVYGGETLFAKVLQVELEDYQRYKTTGKPESVSKRISNIKLKLEGIDLYGNPAERFAPDRKFNRQANILYDLGCTGRSIAKWIGIGESELSHVIRGRRPTKKGYVEACEELVKGRIAFLLRRLENPSELKLIATSHAVGSNISSESERSHIVEICLSRVLGSLCNTPIPSLPRTVPGAVVEVSSGTWIVTGNTERNSAHEWRALARLCEANAKSIDNSKESSCRSSTDILHILLRKREGK